MGRRPGCAQNGRFLARSAPLAVSTQVSSGFSGVAESRVLAWYTLAGLVTMATWTQLDAIGIFALLPIAIVAAIEALPLFWHRSLIDSRWWQEVRGRLFPGRPRVSQVAIGALVCAPLVLHLLVTLGEEFPYGGDEGYHFSATRTFARVMFAAAPWLAAVAVLVAVSRFVARRWVATIAVVSLWAVSMRFGPEMTFARYPAAFYLIALPLNVVAEVARVPNPHVSNHVMNALSVPVWLFLLRPIIVRRWPDIPALVAGLLLFYQPTVITYFGGGGLEPWSIVLLLVALEAAVRLPPEDRWVAVLAAGCASWLKEPAVLFLPVVWLIAMIDWRGWAPELRRGAIPLGIAAATPFITYYFVRRTLELPRSYELLSLAQLGSTARVREWIERVHFQFGDTGMALVLSLPVFAVAGLLVHRASPRDLAAHVAMVLIGIGLVAMFLIEVQGIPYTGYGRYLMFPYTAIAAAIMLLIARLVDRGFMRLAIGIAAFVLAAQAQPLAALLAKDFAPDYARNSLEWHRCLIRLPFRQLAREIPRQPGGDAVTSIRLATITLDTLITRVAYPDVARHYTITPSVLPADAVDCRCRDRSEAVIAGFEYRANFDAGTPHDPRITAGQEACVQQMESSCRSMMVEHAPDQSVVGMLGVGSR